MSDEATDVRSASELTEATVSGLRWIASARLVIELVTLGSMVILARNIPPAAFGFFALVILVQELALGVPGESVGSALVQRRAIDRDHLRGAVLASWIIGAVLTVVGLVGTVIIARPVFGAEAAALVAGACAFFPIGALYAVPVAQLRRRLDFARLSLLDLTATSVRAAASLALALGAGLDASALLLGTLAGALAALSLALRFAPPPKPAWRPAQLRELMDYGRPAGMAAIFWTAFRNGDYAIVNARLGAAQAGIYWRGYQLGVEYQRKVSTVMTQMAFPVLARTADLVQMAAMRRRMAQLVTVVLFPALGLLVVLAPRLVPWLFGPQWAAAVAPTQILALAGLLSLVIEGIGSAMQAAGRARSLLRFGAAHAVVYLVLVLFASSYGLVATCWAAVVSHGLFLVVAYAMLPGRTEPTLACLARDLAPAVVSCAGMAAVALPVDLLCADLPMVLHFGAVGVAAAAGYLAVLALAFPTAAADLRALGAGVVPARMRRGTFVPRRDGVRRRSVDDRGDGTPSAGLARS